MRGGERRGEREERREEREREGEREKNNKSYIKSYHQIQSGRGTIRYKILNLIFIYAFMYVYKSKQIHNI